MKADFGGWLRWVKYAALAMTVALVLWIPAITARTSTRNSTHTSARRSFNSGDAKPEAQKTAGESFKNIQVLKDIPASELIPSMRYVAASLGVGCDYCHQADHFDNDDKPTKQRARNMMKMMFAINQDNFNGKREVTCYTCHRGVAKAASMASLSAATNGATTVAVESGSRGETSRAPETGEAGGASNEAAKAMPSMTEILAKYVDGIGGSAAIEKNQTRVEQGSVEGPRGPHAAIETYRTAPDKAFAIVHRPNGDVSEGVSGEIGWGKTGERGSDGGVGR